MITIYLAGDSTAAQKTEKARPETGWGEPFKNYFNANKVCIKNKAHNGRSTKSFIADHFLADIEREIQPGDYLFIQFGHNDEKLSDSHRGTHPYGDFQTNLAEIVAVARNHGANPVLLTSITRRKYLGNSDKIDPQAVGEYPEAMRFFAKKQQVPLLDMNQITRDYLNQFARKATKKFFMNLPPVTYSNYPSGQDDNTHLTPLGAELIAQLTVQAIRTSDIPLSDYLLAD